jgi:hypothetical protein
MYKAASAKGQPGQSQAQGAGPDGQADGHASGGKDDTVDAEYKVEDEKG